VAKAGYVSKKMQAEDEVRKLESDPINKVL
jgi:hypothetical protein